jgi:oxygen-dependent protoporphyrinogen oxidase
MSRIAIVGGGVAGLAVAHALEQRGSRERGASVVVLERSQRPGGNLRSERTEGYLCEWGANGFLDSVPETLELVRDLGLEPRLLRAHPRAQKRFVFRNGRLHALPAGPVAFLASGLLSWRGKLRILGEPFARRRPEDEDETIHAFAARRIGDEAAAMLIGPMVSGVFGGDARRLSLRACFPKMWQMETDHGGLFRALFAKRRALRRGGTVGAPAGRLTSFEGGVEELVAALAERLRASLRTGCGVGAVTRSQDGFRVALEDGSSLQADAVVLAAPTGASARIAEALDPELSRELHAIPSAPIAVVALGYDAARMTHPLDGFGFLVPRGEGPRLLGVLWDSSLYPNRAPEGRVLLRAMVGGAQDPEAAGLGDAALLELVRSDLRLTMGLEREPAMVRIVRHPVGIPQYTVGHRARLERIDARLARHPGLHVAGNGYRGVAINSCAAEAGPLAERLLQDLGGTAQAHPPKRKRTPARKVRGRPGRAPAGRRATT